MFIIRSAFWLGLALIVLQPQDWDVGNQARAMGEAALDSGKRMAASRMMDADCTSIECFGGKALAVATRLEIDQINPSQASTMQDSPSLASAPVPRPRLDRTG